MRACIAVRFPPTIWLASDRAPSMFSCRFILQRMYIFIINNTNTTNTPAAHVALPTTTYALFPDYSRCVLSFRCARCQMTPSNRPDVSQYYYYVHAPSGLLPLGTSVAFRRYSFI